MSSRHEVDDRPSPQAASNRKCGDPSRLHVARHPDTVSDVRVDTGINDRSPRLTGGWAGVMEMQRLVSSTSGSSQRAAAPRSRYHRHLSLNHTLPHSLTTTMPSPDHDSSDDMDVEAEAEEFQIANQASAGGKRACDAVEGCFSRVLTAPSHRNTKAVRTLERLGDYSEHGLTETHRGDACLACRRRRIVSDRHDIVPDGHGQLHDCAACLINRFAISGSERRVGPAGRSDPRRTIASATRRLITADTH